MAYLLYLKATIKDSSPGESQLFFINQFISITLFNGSLIETYENSLKITIFQRETTSRSTN